MILIILLFLVVTFIYIKIVKPYSFWVDRGVKQRQQVYLLGDSAGVMMRKESFFDMLMNVYNAFPEERYIGMYQGILPSLVLRDPELIKQVTVKAFDHFVDHRQFIPDGVDSLWTKNLFSLKGTQWRHMRATLSPSFTSSKMKVIFNLISECADEYTKYFKKTNGTVSVEMKDLCTRYTNDIIASVAFGIQCDSINDKENHFYMMGKKATTFTLWRNLAFFAYTMAPEISKTFGIRIFPQSVTVFFTDLVAQTIKIREEQGIVRQDMIHLLLEARKGKKKTEEETPNTDAGFSVAEDTKDFISDTPKFEITDTDIAAQALIFFFAGFDTVSSLMCFMGYELAVNPEIQDRLLKEIDETSMECNGKLSYEALTKMKYMDMVVSESLRKWPVAIGTDRICTKSYTIEPELPHEKPIHLNPGDVLWIAINGIHRDPKYYPDPMKFDPERFSDENKDNIQPYTYLPFGLGPRNCIGSRFALLEIKTIFFHMLKNYEFVVTEKTEIPVKISKTSVNLMGENGMWIGLKPRNV